MHSFYERLQNMIRQSDAKFFEYTLPSIDKPLAEDEQRTLSGALGSMRFHYEIEVNRGEDDWTRAALFNRGRYPTLGEYINQNTNLDAADAMLKSMEDMKRYHSHMASSKEGKSYEQSDTIGNYQSVVGSLHKVLNQSGYVLTLPENWQGEMDAKWVLAPLDSNNPAPIKGLVDTLNMLPGQELGKQIQQQENGVYTFSVGDNVEKVRENISFVALTQQNLQSALQALESIHNNNPNLGSNPLSDKIAQAALSIAKDPAKEVFNMNVGSVVDVSTVCSPPKVRVIAPTLMTRG